MTKTNKASASAEAVESARYDVKLNARFPYLGFDYMPGHQHVVDETLKLAMETAGVIADVKQLS